MPKIRGVKPDYWTDDDITDLSIPARLLFIGLWNYACDNGHLQDKSKQIKMRIMPADDVNVAELLRELEDKKRIRRGDGWITIPNLTEHQKPDVRYFTTCDKEGCDDPPEKVSQRKARRVHAVQTPCTHGVHGECTQCALGDGDGDGDGEVMVKGARASKRATSLPKDFRPNDKHQELAKELRIDLRSEWAQFVDFHQAKGSTFKDWDAALRTWIRNADKFRKGPPPLAVVADPSELPPPEESWMRRRPQ